MNPTETNGWKIVAAAGIVVLVAGGVVGGVLANSAVPGVWYGSPANVSEFAALAWAVGLAIGRLVVLGLGLFLAGWIFIHASGARKAPPRAK